MDHNRLVHLLLLNLVDNRSKGMRCLIVHKLFLFFLNLRMFFPVLKRSLLGAFEACSSMNAEVLLGVKGRIMGVLFSNIG